MYFENFDDEFCNMNSNFYNIDHKLNLGEFCKIPACRIRLDERYHSFLSWSSPSTVHMNEMNDDWIFPIFMNDEGSDLTTHPNVLQEGNQYLTLFYYLRNF